MQEQKPHSGAAIKMRQHASQAVKETRCLAELGERGLTAWVLRRLEETDEVEHINGRLERSNAIHRLPQPPQPAPGDSLRLLCAAAHHRDRLEPVSGLWCP